MHSCLVVWFRNVPNGIHAKLSGTMKNNGYKNEHNEVLSATNSLLFDSIKFFLKECKGWNNNTAKYYIHNLFSLRKNGV